MRVSRAWLGLVILMLPTLIVAMDMTALLLALSLAGAVAASRRLPAGRGTELLHAAREAFAVSLHVTGVIAAVIFAGLAVLVLAMRPAVQAIPAGHGHDPVVASQPGGG